nr:transglutaminase-like domain-containing protein [Candidatus Gracilibacteria bacterium]
MFSLVFFTNYSYALDTSTGAVLNAYNSFILKIESKLNLNSQLDLLEKLSLKLEDILKSKSLTTKSIILLQELDKLNDSKLKEIKTKLNIEPYIDVAQLEIEDKEKQKFKDLKDIAVLPKYVSDLLGYNRKYIYVIFSENSQSFEFLSSDNNIKRIIFSKYYELNDGNFNYIKSKPGIIFLYNGNYVFVDDYKEEEKIPYSQSKDYFKGVILTPNFNIFEKNGNYYFYKITQFNYIKDSYGFYLKTFEKLGYNTKDLIVYKNNGVYTFSSSFQEQKLISSDIIQNIVDKSKFLSYVSSDKRDLNYDTDSYFKSLKNISINLTEGLTKENKIKAIYGRILNNITYTNPIDLNKKEIFSGIDTFKNKDGVCEGYVKLMAYMLMFSGIEDIDVILGYVINASDFPELGHAWVKIGTYYYDPTFDDPIGNVQAKSFENYSYYKLPADLFYTNRYDIGDLPEELKTKSKDELNNIVYKNLFNLIGKYGNSNYNLMKYPLFLHNNGLNYDVKVTLAKLEDILTTYYVNGPDMSYIYNGKKYLIKKMKFFTINDENINNVLYSINYDLNGKYFLKWDLGNGNIEYRLAYDFETF